MDSALSMNALLIQGQQCRKLSVVYAMEEVMILPPVIRRLRFSSDADIVRLTNVRIIIIIIIITFVYWSVVRITKKLGTNLMEIFEGM